MTKRVLIGAGVAAVAAVLFWPRHPKKDAPLPPPIQAPAMQESTVRRPVRQEMTDEKRRQVEELRSLMDGAAPAGDEQKSPPALQARDKLKAAAEAFEQKRYLDAVQGYRDAYELVPDPQLLYKAGVAYDRAGNCREALFYFDWYVDERPKPIETEDTVMGEVRARCRA